MPIPVKYDSTSFDPPAPIATVTPRNSVNGKSLSSVLMLIDTGADVTLVPQLSVHALGLSPENSTGHVDIG